MQAIIIAGGKGTRLFPLTYSKPKPMLPLMERPFLAWMVERCQLAGITDILINVHYQAFQIKEYFRDGAEFGVQIRYIQEETPLGTAGAMKLAEPYFTGESLIVFNADILTNLNLEDLIQAHQQAKAKATLTLARVDNPTAFGLVELLPFPATTETEATCTQKVRAFWEKPSVAEVAKIGIDTINAGTYVLEPDLFADYPANEPLSFERRVFPDLLAQEQPVLGFIWDGYWLDLGTPAQYYQGHLDILAGKMPYNLPAIAQEKAPNVWVAASAKIDPAACLIGPCYIGEYVHLGSHANIPPGTLIGANSLIDRPLNPGMYASGTLAV